MRDFSRKSNVNLKPVDLDSSDSCDTTECDDDSERSTEYDGCSESSVLSNPQPVGAEVEEGPCLGSTDDFNKPVNYKPSLHRAPRYSPRPPTPGRRPDTPRPKDVAEAQPQKTCRNESPLANRLSGKRSVDDMGDEEQDSVQRSRRRLI